jgi:23S rRNA (cytidine1920-2'-O)/16S rRNA (cytidine1409-2'-O)-methyltransferase
MEKTNARLLSPASFGPPWRPFDLIAADCSFISLRLILPAAWPLLRAGGSILALVKPQFEAGKDEASRGEGVIRDPAIHARVLSELESFTGAAFPDSQWRGSTESPLLGPAGNKEFLALIERKAL